MPPSAHAVVRVWHKRMRHEPEGQGVPLGWYWTEQATPTRSACLCLGTCRVQQRVSTPRSPCVVVPCCAYLSTVSTSTSSTSSPVSNRLSTSSCALYGDMTPMSRGGQPHATSARAAVATSTASVSLHTPRRFDGRFATPWTAPCPDCRAPACPCASPPPPDAGEARRVSSVTPGARVSVLANTTDLSASITRSSQCRASRAAVDEAPLPIPPG